MEWQLYSIKKNQEKNLYSITNCNLVNFPQNKSYCCPIYLLIMVVVRYYTTIYLHKKWESLVKPDNNNLIWYWIHYSRYSNLRSLTYKEDKCHRTIILSDFHGYGWVLESLPKNRIRHLNQTTTRANSSTCNISSTNTLLKSRTYVLVYVYKTILIFLHKIIKKSCGEKEKRKLYAAVCTMKFEIKELCIPYDSFMGSWRMTYLLQELIVYFLCVFLSHSSTW